MTALGRRTLLWMIPLNLVLIAWVWFGRLAFGVGGWFLLIYAMTVVPALLIGLLVTTILSFTQKGKPRSLTRPQAWAQLVVWLGMFGFGLFSVDFGDTDDSEISALTQLFGRSRALLDLSYTLTYVAGVVTFVAWLVLTVTLIAARRPGVEPIVTGPTDAR